MNANKKIGCCYFPTMVVAVDDNSSFLSLIKLKISKFSPCVTFQDPKKAAEVLSVASKSRTFLDRCITHTEDDKVDHRNIDIDISKIQNEVYESDRFNQVSVAIIDYAMPGMNGAELCQKLKNSPFKKILLTGEAGSEKAIQLFNDGIIDQYINKNEPDHIEKLIEAIADLQFKYFSDISTIVIDVLAKKPPLFGMAASCLDDVIFINFFNSFIKKHKLKEYYLLEETGSFLFLDDNARPSWLLVKSEGDMESTDFDTQEGAMKITPALRKSIEKREVLRHFFDNNWSIEKSDDWKNVLYPAKKLEGKSNYYYSYVTKPLTDPLFEQDKVVSYNAYLADLDAKFFE